MVKIQRKIKSYIKNKIPKRLQEWIIVFFFLYAPIKLIKKIKTSYSGYIQRHLPQKGDVVIDGGAYEGKFTILASRLIGKKGKVIAFEPEKNSYQILRRRIKKLRLNNAIALNFGLWNKRANLSFTYMPAGYSYISIISKNEQKETQIIKSISIDEIKSLFNLKKIDFIKMDIEGAEIEAIDGAKNTLSTCNIYLTIAAYHYRDGIRTGSTILDKLKHYGYAAEEAYPYHPTIYAYKIKTFRKKKRNAEGGNAVK